MDDMNLYRLLTVILVSAVFLFAACTFDNRVNEAAPPEAPSGLYVDEVTTASVVLMWTDNADNESGFIMQRSEEEQSFASVETMSINTANSVSFADSIQNSGTFDLVLYYRIAAINEAVDMTNLEWSNTAEADLLAVPTNLADTAVDKSSIMVQWTDHSSLETSFLLQRDLSSNFTDNPAEFEITSSGDNQFSYTDSGLLPDTFYYYRVKAVKGKGISQWSNILQTKTDEDVTVITLDAPENLASVENSISSSSITLTWDYNSAEGSGFIINYSQNSGFSDSVSLPVNSISTIQKVISGLDSDTSYFFRIRVVDTEGRLISLWSDSLEATTLTDTVRNYTTLMIDTSSELPQFDCVELGTGHNDGVFRLYTTMDNNGTSAYEYFWAEGSWDRQETISSEAYASAPVITALGSLTGNALYLGGWSSTGVLYTGYNGSDWAAPSVINDAQSHSWILAMKAGNGRNDGISRLYASGDELTEYSWNGSEYTAVEVADFLVGRIGIGEGRNDGINRIYAVRRGTAQVYEFTWNPSAGKFDKAVIWTGETSKGSAFIGDGRGDGVERLYVWAGSLYELTWTGSSWTSLLMDSNIWERYYINVGAIGDESPGVYLSVKDQGIYEYLWNENSTSYDVDAISSATGGTAIGDGRNDGVSRLYAGRGTKNHYTDSAIIEISDAD